MVNVRFWSETKSVEATGASPHVRLRFVRERANGKRTVAEEFALFHHGIAQKSSRLRLFVQVTGSPLSLFDMSYSSLAIALFMALSLISPFHTLAANCELRIPNL